MRVVYSTYVLRNLNQQKTCLERAVTTGGTWFHLYRKNQDKRMASFWKEIEFGESVELY